MTPRYRTKLFRSVIDCGCTLSLGDFSEEADLDDVRKWLDERGYVVTRLEEAHAADWGGVPT